MAVLKNLPKRQAAEGKGSVLGKASPGFVPGFWFMIDSFKNSGNHMFNFSLLL